LKIALTIAGSDSGGGAGIQADLKTFHRFGVFGTSVITAITAQNTRGVSRWEAVDASLLQAQLQAVVADLRPAALKSGMLGETEVIEAVAAAISANSLQPYILDPVMLAGSGDSLIRSQATAVLRSTLVPLAALVTPNIFEAESLSGREVRTREQMADAARFLVEELGAAAALVKGGHLEGPAVVDVLFDGDVRLFQRPRISVRGTHGTGCTLSAAITANLAHGCQLEAAVEIAIDYVYRAILLAPDIGGGAAPLNHFA
jgi:hydroxymethylpyrimidine/phosphomethylpyrimidine kinase